MFASPKKVRVRRVKRQLKAAFAIGVALAAGAFLACQKTVTDGNVAEGDAKQDDARPDATVVDASFVDDATASSGPADAALVTTGDASTALAKKPPKRDAGVVDRREHRKGMPVPDNLLE